MVRPWSNEHIMSCNCEVWQLNPRLNPFTITILLLNHTLNFTARFTRVEPNINISMAQIAQFTWNALHFHLCHATCISIVTTIFFPGCGYWIKWFIFPSTSSCSGWWCSNSESSHWLQTNTTNTSVYEQSINIFLKIRKCFIINKQCDIKIKSVRSKKIAHGKYYGFKNFVLSIHIWDIPLHSTWAIVAMVQ